MINILHLRDTDRICGPGKTIIETASAIDKKRYNIIIGLFLLKSEKNNIYYRYAKDKNINIVPLWMAHQFDFLIIYRIIKIIRNNNIDILHSHEYKSDIIAYIVSRIIKIPIVTTIHGWIENTWKSKIYLGVGKKLLRFFNKVIAVSPKIKSQLLQLGVPEENIALIHNAIVVENYIPGNYPEKIIRQEYHIPEGSILIGNIGRLSPEKGQSQFLLAAGEICRHNPDVYFIIIGDGPDREKLVKMAAELQIDKRVIFTGHVDDVRPFYQDLDILALTSFSEGFPNVILEALCMNKPVVATDVGGVADIIVDGVTGYLAQAGDYRAISEKLLNLVIHPEIAGQLVTNGKKLINENYHFNQRVAKIESLYGRLIEQGAL